MSFDTSIRNGISILLLFLIAATSPLYSQLELPRTSPTAGVMQKIGITEVKIDYHRPGVKERTIWGELVPYNEIWRTGANEATKISFSTDVKINGQKLPQGEYSLFTIPSQNQWTVIFNKNTGLWGADGYQESEDALRVQVNPQQAEMHEWMLFVFENLHEKSADAVLYWEKLKVPFTISVETDSLVLGKANQQLSWRRGYQAAGFALDRDLNLQQGRRWLDISLMAERNYWNTSLDARYLAKEGKKQEAIRRMEEALKMGGEMENRPFNYAENEKLLEEWRK
ncbi:MAG: DUF2911 domain-containing protein [Calditrichia bacterium]